ncbi:MAG: hypothetical protein J6V68_03135 [Clostridia bacterium]|nr:hypothetical protein [Clostridia bacterium]
MKKSLLMTIIMTLVLVVAMSTATYAWYTSSSAVSVSKTTVSTATSGSSNLAIGAEAGGNITSISMTMDKAVEPMIPTTNWTVGTTAYLTALNGFNKADIDVSGNFTDSVSDATAATIKTVTPNGGQAKNQENFYVSNRNQTEATGITASVTIDSNQLGLCVAIFADGKLVGVWSNGDVQYGVVTKGAAASSINTTMTKATNPATVSSSVAALGAVEINVIAWFNGIDLTSAEAGQSATFTINFSAVAAVA